jgi:hypothetical protein
VRKSPKETYGRFIELEDKAAAIYLRLASCFSSENPKLSAFWLDMAAEEKHHAVLLQFCVAEKWWAPELPEESDIRKFYTQFRELERQAASRDITVDRAFALAAELEGSEINAIYSHLTMPLHASMYLLKKKIASSPSDHLGHLVAAGKKFSASATTLKKLDALKASHRKTRAA